MAETTPAVEIKNLVKDFKTSFRKQMLRAVDGVSIRIMPGEVYGLIGPNGSGKSTTMKALLGLVAPTAGTCAIFGKDSLKVDSRNDVGFLPENPYFYKHLSGAETLRFYGRLCGLKGRVLEDRVSELLAMVDLEDARDRRIGGYSKGMLQRIGLAQALVQEPRLVILDEPTAGVDPDRLAADPGFDFQTAGARDHRFPVLPLAGAGARRSATTSASFSRGRMVKEGRLEDLIAIEDQTEIIIKDASPELVSPDPGNGGDIRREPR